MLPAGARKECLFNTSLPFTYFQHCAESFTPKPLFMISTSSFFSKQFLYFCTEVMVGEMELEGEWS